MGSSQGDQLGPDGMMESTPLKQNFVYRMECPHRYAPPGYEINDILDYRKGSHQVSKIRQENPWELEKHGEIRLDVRFSNLL